MGDPNRFRIHYNHALGKKYYTAKDYVSDMKRMGMEPYNPNNVKKVERKDYKPSEKARRMISSLNKDKKGNYIVSDRYRDELQKMNNNTSKKAQDMKKELKSKLDSKSFYENGGYF